MSFLKEGEEEEEEEVEEEQGVVVVVVVVDVWDQPPFVPSQGHRSSPHNVGSCPPAAPPALRLSVLHQPRRAPRFSPPGRNAFFSAYFH